MTGLTELPALIETRFSPVRFVEETGSTNADLLRAAAAGATDGTVLVTDHQTQGRGRQKRAWHDEPGNALLVSLLLRLDPAVAPLIPLLTGVAAVDALMALTPAGAAPSRPHDPAVARPGLKWPNDVLAPSLGERKLAGILAESTAGGASGGLAVVVGMGMNLRWAGPPPDDIAARAATVSELMGRTVERTEILELYLRCFERRLGEVETSGTASLLEVYRRRCLTIGRRVRFATSSTTYDGTVVDVSDTGTLLLDTPGSGIVELHAGDAHHLPIDG